MSCVPGARMRAEIAEQPAVFARVLTHSAEALRELHAEIDGHGVRFVLIAARGSSDHAALYAKYLVEILLQLPAGLASPSTFTLYGAQPRLDGVLFLSISQSGSSPDLVESVTAARAGGAFTVALTNDPASPLAAAAERHTELAAGLETSVAATKTYTAELLAAYLLLAPRPGDLSELPSAAERTLAGAGPSLEAARAMRYADRALVIGRGLSYPSALETALKLMETCYMPALAFSSADLLHGPVAMIDAATPVIAVLASGRAGEATRPIVDAVRERGASVVTVGADGDLPIFTGDLPAEVHPMLEILPLQRLALELALARGIDPDRPRGLSKVTRTW